MALVSFGWDQRLREDSMLTTSPCFRFGFLSPKVQLRLVNAIPNPTPSAADAVTGLSTVNTKLVANAATPAPSCAHTSGARRPSEERPQVLEGCGTSRRYRGGSRTDSGRALLPRREMVNRQQSRNGSLNLWYCVASSLRCNHANMLFVLCEKLRALHMNPLVTCTDYGLSLRISHLRTPTPPAVEGASCC